MDWKQAAAVIVGGGLGSFARWGICQIPFLQTQQNFPLPTFSVNMLGCFSIGYLYKMQEQGILGNLLPLLLVTGFLGGFTTFSAFSLDFALLVERKAYGHALAYGAGSVALSLIAVFAGLYLVRTLAS